MKVLIVTQYFWPESFRINDLAKGLVQRGHEVTVLTAQPNYPSGEFAEGHGFFGPRRQTHEGIEILRVPIFPRRSGRGFWLALNYLSFAFFGCLFGPLIARKKYDVIFVPQYSPVTLALPAIFIRRLRNIPLYLWVQDLWPESLSATGAVRSPFILGLFKKLVRYIYGNSDMILVQSDGFVAPILANGADPSKIRFFPNWAEEFYKPDVKAASELPGEFRVVFAGNIGAAQCFDSILDSAEILRSNPKIHFIVFGDGRLKSWVNEEVQRRRLTNFHLLGHRPVTEMPGYFSQANVLLVTLRPDPIFSATLPSKVQSYLASGRPVVGALDGIGKDTLEKSGAGFVCAPGDAKSLAISIQKVFEADGDARKAMGQRGRAYYLENFERNMLLDRLENWMKQESGAQT